MAQCPLGVASAASFNKRAVAAERRRTVVGVAIPKRNANPWKKIWENLIQWGDFLTNKNRIEPCDKSSPVRDRAISSVGV